jgi:hypothetical protein
MTDLSVGDDGFLDMARFSDAELDADETGAADWFTEPDPLPAAAWLRIVSGAVSATDPPPDLDELVGPAPVEHPVVDDGDFGTDPVDGFGEPDWPDVDPGAHPDVDHHPEPGPDPAPPDVD